MPEQTTPSAIAEAQARRSAAAGQAAIAKGAAPARRRTASPRPAPPAAVAEPLAHEVHADAVQEGGAGAGDDRPADAHAGGLRARQHHHAGEARDQRDAGAQADALAEEQEGHQRGEQHGHASC
jgi:hypothetical protein